jgi:hypothetical protein
MSWMEEWHKCITLGGIDNKNGRVLSNPWKLEGKAENQRERNYIYIYITKCVW